MHEIINYSGWPNSIRLFNREAELVITTDIGPRIIRFGFIDKQNLFHQSPEESGITGGNEWHLYGGHRFWLAPETMPGSYYPDNIPVTYRINGDTLLLTQAKETTTGIVKELEITLSPGSNEVTVLHRLINRGTQGIEVAPWGITALSAGGRAIVPHEPYGEGNDYLLPSRSIALWHYTKMNDPRWTWGEKYIQAKHNDAFLSEQKIGILNKKRWSAYSLNDDLLVFTFDFKPGVIYTDYGSNNEVYINEHFLEMETLGPLTTIPPSGVVEHTEHWLLTKATASESEYSIDQNILPLVESFLTTRAKI